MDTRREFLKKAALLSGAAGILSTLPSSIRRALAIDPEPGSTFLDAEHIVILMQENRSFDHCYGTLQGVRGFDDPRAVRLPNKNLVWLQSNAANETYPPFRLDIHETNVTWLGSLPHSWQDQVDARNHGRMDGWLEAKRSGHREVQQMPFTMGHYSRDDIPFYYAFADAFTVCDQHFCSSLTGTTPNRLHLWTGTIRDEQKPEAWARVTNSETEYGSEAKWTTFPERLEENGISWKVYQNELSIETGLPRENEQWLANFTDNPLEWFSQYHVRFLPAHRAWLEKMEATLPGEIQRLKNELANLPADDPKGADLKKALTRNQHLLASVLEEKPKWTAEKFEKLPEREKNLHRKAFATNAGDPDYRELATLRYMDGAAPREVKVPKGDVFHQFRKDVREGKLPTVSWLVASSNFSDHPGSAWYGAWYVAETLDILTKNPDIWKKTIFILTYDENDGYFDHVPPFVAPHPQEPGTGATSPGIDPALEFVTLEQDRKHRGQNEARESPIGLGFRVPMVIASPWSRGGYVCSQVFDHTSVLQFLEKFLQHKRGREIRETNISSWRRAVCGDLTSAFRPYSGEAIQIPKFPTRNEFVETIHRAKFKKLPGGYRKLTPDEIARINQDPSKASIMPHQEKGTRPSCALPYELFVEDKVQEGKLKMTFSASKRAFGDKSAGSAFHVYSTTNFKASGQVIPGRTWAFAVGAGQAVDYAWNLDDFENGQYELHVHGPNGFFRELRGTRQDPTLSIECDYEREKNLPTGKVEIKLANRSSQLWTVIITQDAYFKVSSTSTRELPPGLQVLSKIDTSPSSGWYDFTLTIKEAPTFLRRYAGRVETGKHSITDPLIGQV